MLPIYPEISNAVKTLDVEKLARLIRFYFNNDCGHALNVETLLAKAELPIQYQKVDYQGAVIASDGGGRFKIGMVINTDLNDFDAKFLMIHLFARVILQIQPLILEAKLEKTGIKEVNSPLARILSKDTKPGKSLKLDRAIDELAVALFLPQEFLLKAQKKLNSKEKLAEFFQVPGELISMRLSALKLSTNSANGPSNFFEAEERIHPIDSPHKEPDTELNLNQLRAPNLELGKKKIASYPSSHKNPASKSTKGQEGKSQKPEEAKLPGLKRLRQLAQQFDPSVKIE